MSEFQLLLCCARTRPESKRIRKLVQSGVDWRALLDLAQRHGVRPLVYQSLRAVCPEQLPEEISAELRRVGKAIAGRNLLVTGELLRLAAEFERQGIPLAAMKGPLLGEMAYGDFTLREFSDLDLLIREQDFVKATGLLNEAGYRPGWDVENSLKLQFLRYQGEAWFSSTRGGLSIDVHWRVAPKNTALPLRAEEYWPRFRPLPLAGRTVLSFTAQDLPLYLAAQGGQDQWCDLRRLCDLAELIVRHPGLDWELILKDARRLHGLRNVLLGCHLAAVLLEAPLPAMLESGIRADAAIPKLAGQAMSKIRSAEAPGDLKRILFQVQVQERFRDKVGLAVNLLTDRTDSDGQWLLLPKPLWGLYRVIRPIRMLGKLL